MKGLNRILVATGALVGIALAAPALAEGPTWDDLLNDSKSTENVLTYGMGPWQQRFSPLAKINKDNVARMVPAFAASLGGREAARAGIAADRL